MTDKRALQAELVARLEGELGAMEQTQRATVEGMTHEQARPENDKDTRALEQSYLARGQARRVEELRVAVGETKAMALRAFAEDAPIGISALVTLEDERGPQILFVTIHGGGEELSDGVRVVTTRSPLGRALVGRCAGDEVEVQQGGRVRTLSVVRVR